MYLRERCAECLWGSPSHGNTFYRLARRFKKEGRWPRYRGTFRYWPTQRLPWRYCIMDHHFWTGHKVECDNYWNLDKCAREWWLEDAMIGLERSVKPGAGYISLWPDDMPVPPGWERYQEDGMHNAIRRKGE